MKSKEGCLCGKVPVIEHNKKFLKRVFYPPGW